MNSALVGLKNYSADLGGCYPPRPSPQWITPSSICLISLACVSRETHNLQPVFRPREGWGVGGGGVWVVPYTGYVGMCGAKGYVFLAVLVWNRVSISTILGWNRVWFVHSSLELGMFFKRISFFFIIWRYKTISFIMFTPTTVYVP